MANIKNQDSNALKNNIIKQKDNIINQLNQQI